MVSSTLSVDATNQEHEIIFPLTAKLRELGIDPDET